MAEVAGLPAEKFSSHSLRKVGMSQMRGLGASADDRKDRRNHADGSNVFSTTHDYSTFGMQYKCRHGMHGEADDSTSIGASPSDNHL